MKKLIVDSTGAVVPSTRFVAQQGISRPQQISPLHRLDRLLNKEEPPRILVVRGLGGIGDVLMTTPTVRAIKQKYNNKVLIDYATSPDYLNGALVKVLAANRDIDNIYDYRTIDKTNYAAVINLGDSATPCPSARHEIPGAQSINRIDLFARHSGLPTPLNNPSINYEVLPNERDWALQWLAQRRLEGNKFILINANSSSRRRDMPQRVLQQAIMKILRFYQGKMKGIVVLHDDNKTPDIDWKLEGTTLMLNYSVREIAAMVSLSELVICPDSAILHLASALKKKTVALFGPTDPNARVNYHPEAIAVWPGKELMCKNCWYTPGCKNGMMCWKRITDDMIFEPAVALIENKTLKSSFNPNPYVNFGGLLNTGSIKKQKDQPFEVI